MLDEKQATTPAAVALRWSALGLAIAMSLYHMYVAAFGPPEAVIFRGTHLMFATTLVFLLYPFRPKGGWGWRAVDAATASSTSTTSASPTRSGRWSASWSCSKARAA